MTALTARRLSAFLALALLVVLPFVLVGPFLGRSAAAALTTSQILEIHADSLTTYQVAATPVQDISPLPEQRGVGVDGAVRAAPTFPMHLAGNPFGSPWNANQTLNGVNLITGGYTTVDVDISLPVVGPRWVIGRSYNSSQDDGSHHDSDGYQGKNWFQMSQPELVAFNSDSSGEFESTQETEDMLYLVYGADRYIEFDRDGDNSDEFKAKNGAAGGILFEEDGSGPDTYTYTDQWGYEFIFFGFDAASDPANGQLWKITDPGGKKAFVGYANDKDIAINGRTNPSVISAGYDSSGRIQYAFDSAARRYVYTYTTLDSVDRLTQVKAQTKTGGSWFGTPTGITDRMTVDYEYYSTSESHGEPGDLKLVEITTPLTDSGVSSTRKKYYRYYEGTYNSVSNPGHDHALKMVVDYEGARRFDWEGDSNLDEDFLTASDSSLDPYAAAKFEYNSSREVRSAFFNGACGCSGSATGTHDFEYEDNTSGTFGSGYDTDWATRTIVERPDGSWLTQYFDEAGQSLHQVITDDDPANTSPAPSRWVTKVTRNSDGCVTEISTPANITSYTHAIASFAMGTSTSSGLVRTYSLVSSGDTKGFLLDVKSKDGTSGTLSYESSQTYTTASKLITGSGVVSVVRPLVATSRVFPVSTSSPTSGDYNETSMTYTMYSGELVVEEVSTTLPAVSTANKGSGSAATTKTHYTEQGRKNWAEAEDGVFTYYEYTDGQLTMMIRDADTTNSTDFGVGNPAPSGWTSDAVAVHRKDTYAYDEQGRRTTTTEASGRVFLSYYSRLADQRLATLKYNDYDSETPQYYGPVKYVVKNLAGKPEFQGTVGLTSNESTLAITSHVDEVDSDPIAAVDTTNGNLGDVAQMTTLHYDDSGTVLEEERLYHMVPSSGEGSDGTNYDPTLYAYDDAGRRWRVKEASGTIRRTVYDVLGRATESWIGTNDSSFDGGESSGTDNMVKTDVTEYDSGSDDGNGYVTKRTAFVEDSATDKRETSYTNDYRGRVVLITNPTAPHEFRKLDNMGRTLAVGMFSSAASISVSSDDPTTETANRWALSESAFNERGWVWKMVRHKVDTNDGSDDDNYENYTWYDDTGRVIKVDYSDLAKTFYDRLGRETHRFVLAKDDDSVYGDVDDVGGDHVVLEMQTTYESSDSDNVVMDAMISRHHDDDSTGTTGALDNNADSDELKYTAANVSGRIQITAYWYDSFDRRIDTVLYGNNDTDDDGDMDDFDRDGLTTPARSDTKLRTTRSYNTDGTLKEVTDPRDLDTRYEYDAAGRQTKVIRNYVDGSPASLTSDDDQTVVYAFTDGLRTSITADLYGTADDQVTTYTYGTSKGASAGDSEVASGHLLQEVKYPDSTGASDVVSYAYNAQSRQTWKEDQAGNVIETTYDDSGRETERAVTTLDADFGGDVRRIVTEYDSLGRREKVTQYDAATSGSVTDQVQFIYSKWGDLATYKQDNDGTIDGGGVPTYEVAYAIGKSTSGRNTTRRTKVTLPNGHRFGFKYLSTGNRLDADLSRVSQIEDLGIYVEPPGEQPVAFEVVEYEYNGLREVVGRDYLEPEIRQERFSSTSGHYSALDSFNRVVEDEWEAYRVSSTNLHDVDLAYDRNSNIIRIDDNVHSTKFDATYAVDGLDRLTATVEGDLNGNTTIQTKSRQQSWTLEQTGNWKLDNLDLNGDDDYVDTGERSDDRTHNDVNEITARDINDDGTDDYMPVYDALGNLIDDGESYRYQYDAYSRLVLISNQSDVPVIQFRYNGLGHRIAEWVDSEPDGDLDAYDEWRHLAFDERWRVVAVFVESDTDPIEQFVHHAAGLDGSGGGVLH